MDEELDVGQDVAVLGCVKDVMVTGGHPSQVLGSVFLKDLTEIVRDPVEQGLPGLVRPVRLKQHIIFPDRTQAEAEGGQVGSVHFDDSVLV